MYKNFENKRKLKKFTGIREPKPANLDQRVTPVDDVEEKCVAFGDDGRKECVTSDDDDRGKVTRLLRCAHNDIRCLGRSMIEMLGVLAIIGVLSVGGLAGYSKAMEKFKVNKAIGEYSYLINGFLEHIDNLKRNHKSGETYGLSEFAKSAGLLPQLWPDVTNISSDGMSDGMLQDSYGSYVRMYMSSDELLTFDFWIGGLDNDEKSYGFDVQFCQELFNNLAKPLHYAVHDVLMYHKKTENSSGSKWYGSSFCNKTNKKCLYSLTLSDINSACSSCVKGEEGCAVIIRF